MDWLPWQSKLWKIKIKFKKESSEAKRRVKPELYRIVTAVHSGKHSGPWASGFIMLFIIIIVSVLRFADEVEDPYGDHTCVCNL